MALYPDLTMVQGSIRQMEKEANEKILENCCSDSDDDIDYVPVEIFDGEKEHVGILPLPPKLSHQQTSQVQPRSTGSSVVYSVPPEPYAKIDRKRNFLKDPKPRPETIYATCQSASGDTAQQNGNLSLPDISHDQTHTNDLVNVSDTNNNPSAPQPLPRSISPHNADNGSTEASAASDTTIRNLQNVDVYGRKASGKQEIILWFNKTQSNSLTNQNTSVVPPWFHGLISRDEAESRLENEPIGCFLIRFSESRFGYSLSIRAEDRIRHYMIDKDKKKRKYLIVNERPLFSTLRDLVEYYKQNNVSTWDGKLTKGCGEGDKHVVYDNWMGIRRPVDNQEQSSTPTPTGGITPAVVNMAERPPARPPRTVDRHASPPLPARRKIVKSPKLGSSSS